MSTYLYYAAKAAKKTLSRGFEEVRDAATGDRTLRAYGANLAPEDRRTRFGASMEGMMVGAASGAALFSPDLLNVLHLTTHFELASYLAIVGSSIGTALATSILTANTYSAYKAGEQKALALDAAKAKKLPPPLKLT